MREALDALLDENYDNLTSEDCKERVIHFLESNNTISPNPILFIKNFTRVADHILRLDPGALDNLEERLYNYNLEGIEMIKTEDLTGLNINKNADLIEAHLNGYAANIQSYLFSKTDIEDYLKLSYRHFSASAKQSEDIADYYSSCQHEHAGEKSRELSNRSDQKKDKATSIDWLKKQIDHLKKAAELKSHYSKKESAFLYFRIGGATKSLFLITNNKKLPRKAIKSYETALEYLSGLQDDNSREVVRIIHNSILRLDSFERNKKYSKSHYR